MNKLTMVLLFVAVCFVAFGFDGVPSPSEPRPMTDLLAEISQAAVTITATSTVLFTGPGYVIIKNVDAANTLYYGDSLVTAVDGMPLGTGEQIAFGLSENETLYGVASTAQTVDIRKLSGR